MMDDQNTNLHLLKKDRVLLTALPWPVPCLEACPVRLE